MLRAQRVEHLCKNLGSAYEGIVYRYVSRFFKKNILNIMYLI